MLSRVQAFFAYGLSGYSDTASNSSSSILSPKTPFAEQGEPEQNSHVQQQQQGLEIAHQHQHRSRSAGHSFPVPSPLHKQQQQQKHPSQQEQGQGEGEREGEEDDGDGVEEDHLPRPRNFWEEGVKYRHALSEHVRTLPSVIADIVVDYLVECRWEFVHDSSQISEDGLTITSSQDLRFECPTFICSFVMTQRVYCWEVEIEFTKSRFACVGVCPADFRTTTQGLGWKMASGKGWAFDVGDGCKVSHTIEETAQPFCQPLVSRFADPSKKRVVVGVRLDLTQQTIEFFRDGLRGQSLGVAFENVVAPVRPAVSFDGGSCGVISIRIP